MTHGKISDRKVNKGRNAICAEARISKKEILFMYGSLIYNIENQILQTTSYAHY